MPQEEPDASRPPLLRLDNLFAVRAHGVLRRFRRYHYATDGFREPQPLLLADIEQYAAKFGPHRPDRFRFFLEQIGVMEEVFMEITMEDINLRRRRTKRGGDG